MPGHFLFGGEAEITEEASVTRFVAGRRFAIETVMGERPIGRRLEIAVIASVDSAGMLRQHSARDRVLGSQVLIERNPVAKVDWAPAGTAQVTVDLFQFAHNDCYRFVDNVDAVEMPFRFQVNSHCVAAQIANPAQTAKERLAAMSRRIGTIAFQMLGTRPVRY